MTMETPPLPARKRAFARLLDRALVIVCAYACAGAAAKAFATDAPRQRLSLEAGWKFHLGDAWPGALRLDEYAR